MKKNKLKIGVFLGGPSKEYEVSLKSGKNLIKNLDLKKFIVYKIFISKDLKVKIYEIEEKNQILVKSFSEIFSALNFLKKNLKLEYLFLALHGYFGEDGKLQTLLEIFNFKYSGSGPEASMLGMDKIRASMIFETLGLKVPEFFFVSFSEWQLKKKEFLKIIKERIGFPLIVKPNHQGSSVGISLVKNLTSLDKALKKASLFDKEIMIQKYISGIEVSCGVLENNGITLALPPIEIIPKKSEFFDYQAKYENGASFEICPPKNISLKIQREIQASSILAHQGLGCKDFSRVDFILEKKSASLYILEVNTLPGLTKNSLIPKELKKAQIDFKEFLEILIKNAKISY